MTGLRKADDSHVHPSTPSTDGEPSLLRAGANTADAVLRENKTVKLEVKVPKGVRKKLRKEAERRGVPLDVIVVEALQAHLN
jgi:hypothetical protein